MNNIQERLLFEKEIVEQLIDIDNDVMKDKLTFKNYYDNLKTTSNNINIKTKTIFITEGNPFIINEILNAIKYTPFQVIIYIDKSYLAMNEWLIKTYKEIYNNYNIELDLDNNYNKYINSNYQIIPVGSKALKEQVKLDFNL